MSAGGKVMMAAGVVLLLVAAASGWRACRFVATAQRAVGVVVRSTPGETGDRSSGHPTIQFSTADGGTIRAFQHSGASVPYGTRLPVLYRPSHPENATMASFGSLWAPLLSLTWLGLVLFVGPLFGLRPGLRT